MFKALRLAANCICVWGLLLLPTIAGTKTVFPAGKNYVFYRGSASSEAKIFSCPPAFAPVYKYMFSSSLTGESTTYAAGEYPAAEIVKNYEAEVLFTETVCGTVNYYCYTEKLGDTVKIGEYAVNLHIAENAAQTAAGTPIIFGGF